MNDDLLLEKEILHKLDNSFSFTYHKVVFMSCQLNTIFYLDLFYSSLNGYETSK